MNTKLKPEDRVRLKDTISFGTVVRVVGGSAGERGPVVMVEWDGHEGVPDAVRPEDLTYVRPPPSSRSGYARPLPFGGW